jgi:hypothetical protein
MTDQFSGMVKKDMLLKINKTAHIFAEMVKNERSFCIAYVLTILPKSGKNT